LVCTHGEDIGRRWSTWEDMDDRVRWARKEKDEKGFYTVDLVETFFSKKKKKKMRVTSVGVYQVCGYWDQG